MTYQEVKDQIDQVIKANNQKEITGPVLNNVMSIMLQYTLDSRWGYLEADLNGAQSYINEALEGKDIRQLIIINQAQVISSLDAWLENPENFDPQTGRINFLGETYGKLQIFIRPEAQ